MAGSDRGGRGVALATQPSLDEPRHARWRSVPAYAVGPAVALITAPILARALGDSGRGTLASLLQPLTIVDAAIGGGLPLAAAYYVSRGVPAYHVFNVASHWVVGSRSSCSFSLSSMLFLLPIVRATASGCPSVFGHSR